jgi:signal recognition particle subunit SEC65
MKKVITILMLGFVTQVFAGNDPYITATETYDARQVVTEKSIVTWLRVDDVPTACRKKSAELGVSNNFVNPRACSFWSKESCIIITSKQPKLGSLEHEVRHCFQGDWH